MKTWSRNRSKNSRMKAMNTNKERVECIIDEIVAMWGLDKNIMLKGFLGAFKGAVRGISEEEATQVCARVWEILNK